MKKKHKIPLSLNIIKWYLIVSAVLIILSYILMFIVDKELVLETITERYPLYLFILLSITGLIILAIIIYGIQKRKVIAFYLSMTLLFLSVLVSVRDLLFYGFDLKEYLGIILSLAIAGIIFNKRDYFRINFKINKVWITVYKIFLVILLIFALYLFLSGKAKLF